MSVTFLVGTLRCRLTIGGGAPRTSRSWDVAVFGVTLGELGTQILALSHSRTNIDIQIVLI